MFIPYILWQFLLLFLIRGLVFSPHKIFTAKNKPHAPRENQCTTLWHFNGFLSHEMIHLFFLIVGETLFRPRCWIDIHRNLPSNILPSHFTEDSAFLTKNSVPRVFHIIPRVFHQTMRFPPDPEFSTPREPVPWAVDFSQAPTQTPGNHHLIMKNAPHITTNAPRIMMANKALHIMTKAPHIMTKAPHIMTKAPHIMTKALHIMTKAPHIMTKAPHIMTKAPHIMTKALHITTKALHIMWKAPHIT